MNYMTVSWQFGRHEPVSPSKIPTHIGSRFNGLAMGTVFQIAGSSSQVLIDAATLQQFAEDADHCIAMAGQVGSQVKMRVGSSWLVRSEEHTSELQSLMRISYAVFCLKKKTTK